MYLEIDKAGGGARLRYYYNNNNFITALRSKDLLPNT